MNCSKCKNENSDDRQFCQYCGATLPAVKSDSRKSAAKKNKFKSLAIIGVIVAISIIGGYFSEENRAIEKQDEAVEVLDKTDNYDEAINMLQEASFDITNNEERIKVLVNMALAYEAKGDDENALAKYKEALIIPDKDSFKYYVISGSIAELEGRMGEAENNYFKAYEKDKDDYQLLTILGVFYLNQYLKNEDNDMLLKAIEFNKKAHEQAPQNETAMENLAEAYYYLGEYKKAIDLYLQTSYENKAYNNYTLGFSYYNLNDMESAKNHFQKAVDLGAEVSPEVYEFLNN